LRKFARVGPPFFECCDGTGELSRRLSRVHSDSVRRKLLKQFAGANAHTKIGITQRINQRRHRWFALDQKNFGGTGAIGWIARTEHGDEPLKIIRGQVVGVCLADEFVQLRARRGSFPLTGGGAAAAFFDLKQQFRRVHVTGRSRDNLVVGSHQNQGWNGFNCEIVRGLRVGINVHVRHVQRAALIKKFRRVESVFPEQLAWPAPLRAENNQDQGLVGGCGF
jgi:hypothetical protein